MSLMSLALLAEGLACFGFVAYRRNVLIHQLFFREDVADGAYVLSVLAPDHIFDFVSHALSFVICRFHTHLSYNLCCYLVISTQ